MVLIKVISFLFKEICHNKRSRYRRSGRNTRKEDYKWVKTKFQIVKVQIVKLVKHKRQVTETIKEICQRLTVTILLHSNVANGQTQEMKFKKAESLIVISGCGLSLKNSSSITQVKLNSQLRK
jgi:preprotein translocase subunit SecA